LNPCYQQPTIGRRVVTWKIGDLLLKILETEIYAKPVSVLMKELADNRDV
jgi:hypothetical protein